MRSSAGRSSAPTWALRRSAVALRSSSPTSRRARSSGVRGDAAELLGGRQGVVESADRVDEPDGCRLAPGPNPTPRDVVELGGGNLAIARDPLGEIVIDAVERGLEALVLLGREIVIGAIEPGIRAGLELVPVDAELVP
jgi:hypothetical protein